MYVVGFFSPKEKAGVTETALSIFHELKNKTTLSVAFVSNEKLEKEPTNPEMIYPFKTLSLTEKRKQIAELKSKVDIVIFDASSKMTDDVLKLLPIMNRLFVLGEEHVKFTEMLYKMLEFNRLFDKKSKKLVHQVHNRGAFIVNNPTQKIGFSNAKEDIQKVCKMIHNDFLNYSLEQTFSQKYTSLVKKLLVFPVEQIGHESYKLGIEFHKSLLFSKYIQLRIALGQEKEQAVENILSFLLENDYDIVLQAFQQEMSLAQISFQKKE
jgi:hypothetical protein